MRTVILALLGSVLLIGPAMAAGLTVVHYDNVAHSAAFSPDGTRVVTASDDKTAHIWDATTGNEITVLRGHERAVNSAAFSPDGTRIVTASDDKTSRIWETATGKQIMVLAGHESM